MYLIVAEAAGYPEGVKRLNELRAKRGVPALQTGSTVTAANFMARIMHERRVEFFAEGQRWYDLRRWFNSGPEGRQAVRALCKYRTGEAAGSRPQASDKLNIAENGYNLLWPITTVAIDNDRNLLPNNPGY